MTSALPSRRHALAALASTVVLAACGGGGDGDNGSANVRAINLTTDLPSADLYLGDTKQFSALTTDTLASSVSVQANTYTVNVKAAGDAASLFTGSYSVAKDMSYAAVIWGRKASLRVYTIGESEDTANLGTGNTGIRMFNATLDSGTVDVYVTEADVDISTVSPTQSGLTSGSLAGFRELTGKSYRIRVTGTGDPSDVRLDIPDVALAAKTYYTLILTQSGAGGVLLNATLLAQGGGKTNVVNTKARVRVVASVADSGVVSARAGTVPLVTGWQSPRVGPNGSSYVQVEAGSVPLSVQVNGSTLPAGANSTLAAGSDYTLLVYGAAADPQVKLLADDNRVPSINTRAKLRLVNGLTGAALLSGQVSSATTGTGDIASGEASDYITAPAVGSTQIDVFSSDRFNPIFTLGSSTSTQSLLVAQGVYTIFIMDGVAPGADGQRSGRVVRDR